MIASLPVIRLAEDNPDDVTLTTRALAKNDPPIGCWWHATAWRQRSICGAKATMRDVSPAARPSDCSTSRCRVRTASRCCARSATTGL